MAGGEYSEAKRVFNELIEAVQRSNPEDVAALALYKCSLAVVYMLQGHYEEAGQTLLDMSETDTPWWEAWSPGGYPHMGVLGEIFLYQGRYDEAEQNFNQFLDEQGDAAMKHRAMPHLGYLYMAQGRYQDAADLFGRGIEYGNRELPGKDHPTTLAHMNGLAVLHTRQRQYREAERLFDEVLEARQRRLGEDHPDTLETMNDFGVLRREQQRYDEAESLLRQALDGRQHKLGSDHPACLESKHELAMLYMRQARYEDAEPLLLDAYNGRETKLGPEHPHTIESLKQLANLYESWGKSEQAAKWRAKLMRHNDAEE